MSITPYLNEFDADLETKRVLSVAQMMLLTEIRLFANAGTPTYHVVVGDVTGNEKVAAMLTKAEGMITVEPMTWPGASDNKSKHWMPHIWPLPFCTIQRL
jgi:hypothetical protein